MFAFSAPQACRFTLTPRRFSAAQRFGLLAVVAVLPVLGGCRDSYLAAKQKNEMYSQQIAEAQNAWRQMALEYRALEQKNNQLQLHLADQGTQLQAKASDLQNIRAQYKETAKQLADANKRLAERDKQVQTLTASQERRGSDVKIKPNNSLSQELPQFGIPGVQARREGDVVRVSLPKAVCFDGAGRLTEDGRRKLAVIAQALLDTYTYHMFAIEGHVKPSTAVGYTSVSDHARSVELAGQVFETVAGHGAGRLSPRQVNVLGCGSNYADRFTDEFQVDIVVYPERMP